MPYATKTFSKEKIFALTEKYSIGIGCKGGVEISHCQIDTIKEYLPQATELLLSIVTEPLFAPEDLKLAKSQRVAEFQQESQNPESRVNTLVNTVFYALGHPYRLLPDDGIAQTESFKVDDLKRYHASVIDASSMYVIYAGPKLGDTTKIAFERALGPIKKLQRTRKTVDAPLFSPEKSFVFEHRPIPTAYIRIKFNAPSVLSPDAAAAEVMFEVLSEKLNEEVRTKRSLSYSIHSATIQYHQGIGMIAATTSKPKETLQVISDVIKTMQDKGLTQEELNEYRNIFTTSYYLTMETHGDLSNALSTAQAYHGDANKLYDLPAKLTAVTASDIQRVAKETLHHLRIGVVFDQDKFSNDWITPLKSL
jgi:zinc protease